MEADPRYKAPRVSVYHRPGTAGWCVRWRERDGRQRQRSGYRTEEDAQSAAVEERRRLRSPVPAAREPLLVGTLIRSWFNHGTASLKPGTVDLYGWAMELLLAEPIVDLDAYELTTADVNRWSREVGKAPGTVRIMLTVLSAAFRHGVEEGDVAANPIRGARRPKEAKQLVTFPTMEDVLRLAMTAPSVKWRALLLVAAFCGLRQGEAFALRWEDISADEITVRAALSGKARDRTTPKTEQGLRRVPILPEHHAVLEQWRTESRGKPGDLCWTTNAGGALGPSTFAQLVWKQWRVEAGVGIMWRHLRHFYASTLAQSGATLSQCSTWMGHGSVVLTLDRYAYLFDADTPGVLERMRERIG